MPHFVRAADEPPALVPAAETATAVHAPDAPVEPPVGPAAPLYATIAVNGAPRGSFLVSQYPNGDFALRQSDLEAIGMRRIVGRTIALDGEPHVLLGSLEGATFAFDERRVRIDIQIDPLALKGQVLDARGRLSRFAVEYPRDTSAFFNYGYNYDDTDFVSQTLSGEFGIRYGDFLFLHDGFFEHAETGNRSVRLRTSLTYDNRETLQQAVLGDFTASSGALGSTLSLGGISFSRNYRIDPYFIRYPYASYSGLAFTRSTYEVFLNGNRISTGAIEPGPFDITNIQGPFGVSDVEVVVRDAFGREQFFAAPFYFTQAALREGLNEYNVALGNVRRQFGLESNDYGPPAATGFYRYGISDYLTVGARGEASEDIFNLGPNLTVLAGRWGLFNTTLSYSNDSQDDGLAGVFDYAIQTRAFNATAHLLMQSRRYARIGALTEFNTRFQAGGSFSVGPFTFDYLTSRPYQGVDRTAYGVSVTPRLPAPRTSVFASLRRIAEAQSRTEFFVGLNYYFDNQYSVSGSHQSSNGDHLTTATVQKAIPVGEGWGFSAQASHLNDARGSGHIVRPFVQYNAKYATLVADYQKLSVGDDALESKRFAVQGSVSALGSQVMLSRPVTDAFALVQVDGLEGVRVYQGGELSGTTDSRGRLLVPALGSYVDNQISVDDRDVPISFELKRYTKLISPGLRGGAVLDFGASRIQAVAGTLYIVRDDRTSAVRYGEISLQIDGQRTGLPVGETGEFFIEKLPPGTYALTYIGEAGACSLNLEVPASDEPIIELGAVLCSAE